MRICISMVIKTAIRIMKRHIPQVIQHTLKTTNAESVQDTDRIIT